MNTYIDINPDNNKNTSAKITLLMKKIVYHYCNVSSWEIKVLRHISLTDSLQFREGHNGSRAAAGNFYIFISIFCSGTPHSNFHFMQWFNVRRPPKNNISFICRFSYWNLYHNT